ncbi:MAG: hypothetical protein JNL54_18200 [Kineosporiaceae bacterium]|nr:hypothetical protein [Kineosporiaceae bacterium]
MASVSRRTPGSGMVAGGVPVPWRSAGQAGGVVAGAPLAMPTPRVPRQSELRTYLRELAETAR